MISITGAIHTIFPKETYNGFEKRVAWIKQVNVQNPQIYQIEFWNQDISALGVFSNYTGLVECEIELKGRHWEKNGKEGVVNTLRCVGMKKI